MPICGRCRVGFEPDEVCPECECPDGTWRRHLREHPISCVLLKSVIAVPLLCFASYAVCLGAFALVWGGAAKLVQMICFVVVVVLMAPVLLLMLVFGGSLLSGPPLILLNSLIWIPMVLVIRGLLRRLRVWAARRRSKKAAEIG